MNLERSIAIIRETLEAEHRMRNIVFSGNPVKRMQKTSETKIALQELHAIEEALKRFGFITTAQQPELELGE